MSYDLPSFPPRGDQPGWSRWWAAWNAVNASAPTEDLVGGLAEPADLPDGVVPLSVAVDEAFARLADRQKGDVQ
jgi:hypothetical protein